jgi:hypothetical protein
VLTKQMEGVILLNVVGLRNTLKKALTFATTNGKIDFVASYDGKIIPRKDIDNKI